MSGTGSNDSPYWAAGAAVPPGDAPAEGLQNGFRHLPLLDPAVFADLEADTGGSGVARTFVRDYIGMWTKRIEYLASSLADKDLKRAKDAVLSIKNAALMVGAARLAHQAGELERATTAGDIARLQASLPQIARTGAHTLKALQESYLQGASKPEAS